MGKDGGKDGGKNGGKNGKNGDAEVEVCLDDTSAQYLNFALQLSFQAAHTKSGKSKGGKSGKGGGKDGGKDGGSEVCMNLDRATAEAVLKAFEEALE